MTSVDGMYDRAVFLAPILAREFAFAFLLEFEYVVTELRMTEGVLKTSLKYIEIAFRRKYCFDRCE